MNDFRIGRAVFPVSRTIQEDLKGRVMLEKDEAVMKLYFRRKKKKTGGLIYEDLLLIKTTKHLFNS